MESRAVVLKQPRRLSVESLKLREPKADEVVVDVLYSGVSTGTERLFWTGDMPPFPGMGYPLVPGYETLGEVVDAGKEAPMRTGDLVFAPGADCYDGARGLFGGASSRVVCAADRVVSLDQGFAVGDEREAGVMLALAATARHALAQPGALLPDLIVGHGALGRLLARLTLAAGGPAPTVWERDVARRETVEAYPVIAPEEDERRDYRSIYDASGDPALLDSLVARLARGGEIVLAGFYPGALSLNFAPAFMREARFRIAAEWARPDLLAVRSLVESGALSLSGLVTHRRPFDAAPEAYGTAFNDPACLKMVLDWRAAS